MPSENYCISESGIVVDAMACGEKSSPPDVKTVRVHAMCRISEVSRTVIQGQINITFAK